MNTIIFGFKGSGKTHFGKLLAKESDRPFLDTDELLASAHQMSTEKLHALVGEEKFRELESFLIQGLIDTKNSIIALGGGVVLRRENVELLLKIGRLIYLDCDFESLRIHRTPSFAKDKDLFQIYCLRKPIYESIPSRRIKVDGHTESEVLKALNGL